MISILLATYNGEKYIQSSIESVLNQTFSDFELLIGFNGTIDKSKNLVLKYDDNRIRTFDYGNDKGKSKTLNKLIKEAKYNWIALQDDDDIWLPKKLESQIPYFSEYDVVGTLITYINTSGYVIGRPDLSTNPKDIINKSMIGKNQVANSSSVFKKQDVLDINGWRDEVDGVEDYDLWLRLMRSGKKFINVPEELVLHRLHNNSNFNTKKFDLNKIL